MKRLHLFLALVIVLNFPSFGQVLSPTQNQISNSLNQKYNGEYLVLFVSTVEELSNSSHEKGAISDMYNTLGDKKIFLAHSASVDNGPTPLGVFGIFDENMIWDSGPIVSPFALAGYSIYSVDDLNKDGLIDITTSWIRGNDQHIQEFWIFNWDGSNGELISAVQNDNTSEITFRSNTGKFVDVNLDGISEILAKKLDGEQKLFAWNGIKYNDAESEVTLLPRNGVEIKLKAGMAVTQNAFIYSYSLTNQASSIQSVENLYITKYVSDIKNGVKPNNWSFNPNIRNNFVRWHTEPILSYHREALIKPGEKEDSLKFTSEGLPAIVRFYVQGNNGNLSFGTEELVTNSFSGKTIAPVLPPDPFDHLNFLDSLRSYIPQSQDLNWLGDASFATQLEDQLGQVRSQLAAVDSAGAAATLTDFIQLVEDVNAGASLTSEGYALLYFNAQYLLDRLPEPQAADPSVIPDLPAALVISSAQASGSFSGDNFTISGTNHTAEGIPTGGGGDVNGILTSTTAGRQGILNGLQAFQQDNITGSGTAPDIITGSLDFDAQALIDSVLNHIDQTIPANASGTYGSMEEPVVVHANQGIQSSGAITGYGILLVDGPLQVSGTANWTGLVIQRGMPSVGPATSVSASLSITGGMLVYNEGPFGASLQVSNELVIRTSTEALQNLRDHLEF